MTRSAIRRSRSPGAADLLARLTAEEKVAVLHQFSPAVPRPGLDEFRCGTEGVHGASWRDGDGDFGESANPDPARHG